MCPSDPSAELLQAARLSARLADEAAEANIRAMIYLGLYSRRERRVEDVRAAIEVQGQPDIGFVRFAIRAAESDVEQPEPPNDGSTGYASIFPQNGVLVCLPPDRKHESSGGALGRCFLYRSPGFISRLTGFPLSGETSRIYIALRPANARWYLSQAHDLLKRHLSGFAMKCLANPRAYHRADAAVLYVRTEELTIALESIVAALKQDCIGLRPKTPLGTREIMPGLAWADSLANEAETAQSFGQWVTALIFDASRMYGEHVSLADLSRLCEQRGRMLREIYRRRAN